MLRKLHNVKLAIKNKLKDKKDPITIEFKKFISSLQHNINESIDENQAAEMLSQHLITI